MGELEKLATVPISPIYWQGRANDPIDLGQTAVRFEHKGTIYNERASVELQFVPQERLQFKCSLEGKPPFFGRHLIGNDPWEGDLELVDRGVTVEAHCSGVRSLWSEATGTNGAIILSSRYSNVTISPPTSSILSATFHLLNFPKFLGSEDYILAPDTPPFESKRLGRVVLRADGWVITVIATDLTDSLCAELSVNGGCATTHVGKIARADGAPFSSERLESMLNCLHFFLSFALGRWAGVLLPVAFDSGGSRVFEQWGTRFTADGAWNGSSSWFDCHNSELLPQVFPGFVALWANSIWREPLGRALYWYLGACDRRVGIGVDTGLILAQTALEILAWTYCVVDRKMISAHAFGARGLSAADKLRLVASALSIPLQIPPQLTAIGAAAAIPPTKWADSMDAITSLRNSLVHPSARPVANGTYYEAWKLSLWYLDIILLKLCAHNGKYANRLAQRWVGQVEQMP